MHIKIGFDIELAITSPMALLYLLHVHPSRRADLVQPDIVTIEPIFLADEYVDVFGNQCGRVNAQAGVSQVRFYSEAVIQDSGLPDEVNWAAWQYDPTDLPLETLQYLLPSRYCEVDSELLQRFQWEIRRVVLPGSPVQFVRQPGILNDRLAVKTHMAHARLRIHPPALIAKDVNIFVGQKNRFNRNDVGLHQISAPGRMDVQKVEDGHRRRDGQLNVETDFDVHWMLPEG